MNLKKNLERYLRVNLLGPGPRLIKKTSSLYDCTVEDVEYIYNKLGIHIFNSKRRLSVL